MDSLRKSSQSGLNSRPQHDLAKSQMTAIAVCSLSY